MQGGLVEQVQIVGERITLTENELEEIPGIHGECECLNLQKIYNKVHHVCQLTPPLLVPLSGILLPLELNLVSIPARKFFQLFPSGAKSNILCRQNISPLVSNVSGNRSFKWGSYEQALSSFLVELRSGRVTKDTTKIIRTRLATP